MSYILEANEDQKFIEAVKAAKDALNEMASEFSDHNVIHDAASVLASVEARLRKQKQIGMFVVFENIRSQMTDRRGPFKSVRQLHNSIFAAPCDPGRGGEELLAVRIGDLWTTALNQPELAAASCYADKVYTDVEIVLGAGDWEEGNGD